MKICSKCKIEKDISEFNKDKSKNYYIVNKEKINKRHQKHYKNNKSEYSIRHIQYNSKRLKEDISFKILNNFRRRLLRALKDERKSSSSLNLLGCTSKDLKKYLESQFIEDMSWDNYGLHGWHIDHIKPCAKFDLSKESEQRACFHYTNLQPLWAEKNWLKSDK